MPELPEVETIKRQLSDKLVGMKILSIELSDKNMRFNPDKTKLKLLSQEKITDLHRRNKYLIVETTNLWLVFHLGMSGQVIVRGCKEDKQKHEHVTITLGKICLSLVDPRRFGGFAIYEKKDTATYEKIELFKNLGIEPFSDEYTLQALKELLKKRKQNIKQFLLDSSNICGIGNIYASEIMFLTKLSPFKSSEKLKPAQINLLYKNITKVLALAIEQGGSSISDFVHVNGQSGKMQDLYKVYSRTGQPCLVCNSIIKKETQAGRSTFFCPSCQK